MSFTNLIQATLGSVESEKKLDAHLAKYSKKLNSGKLKIHFNNEGNKAK